MGRETRRGFRYLRFGRSVNETHRHDPCQRSKDGVGSSAES